MDDLNSFILIWAFIFGITQLMGFLIDLIAWAVIVLLMFVHSHLTGPDTIARLELKKYLKAQKR